MLDIQRISLAKKEENEIIKPKDILINELYQENVILHKKLSKQVNLVNKAEKYEKEKNSILADNENLHNKVKQLEKDFENKTFDLEWEYKNKIHKLEKENNYLYKVIDKFKETIEKFIKWICKKFDMGAEDNLIRDFEKETNILINPEKQLKKEERKKEWNLEL